MSSALYAATCVSRTGTVAEIELRPTPAIDPHFSLSDFYALAVLHEAAIDSVYRAPTRTRDRIWRRAAPDSALARALPSAEDMIELASTDTPAPRTLTSRFVARAAYVATRNWQPTLCTPTNGIYACGVTRDTPGLVAAYKALLAVATTLEARSPSASACSG